VTDDASRDETARGPGAGGASERVELEGHLIDSLTLAKVLDAILAAGADYEVVEMSVGRRSVDPSRAVLEVRARDAGELDRLLAELRPHGVNRLEGSDARLERAERDGVLPSGFYATTNLPTSVRVEGSWVAVEDPEMDCALVASPPGAPGGSWSVRTAPMHRVRAGDLVVVGHAGVRVASPPRPRDVEPGDGFAFMDSGVSSEKPKHVLLERVAAHLRRSRTERRAGEAAGGGARGGLGGRGKVLVVCGPAVVHTGAGPALARLVREGFVDVLFAGNGFAAHDIESNVYGTSLGVFLGEGTPAPYGHANHLRVINEVRRRGSIGRAVESGFLRSGVLYECVRRGVPFVLAGSVRDDGPLPDVITDTVAAADLMREHVRGVTVCLMLASTLHAIATGNLLPAGVVTYCVDINPAVATKLGDRGSHQAVGIVTDVGLFLAELADRVVARPPAVGPSGTDGPRDAGVRT